ncbi:hypothetical protein [Streptomyces sp. NBC_00385]|uniref:hypothetical protein n=1 Tax=Streptomyces sp. NBC_00385 TaxID=2975733 RepID=UPI002DDC7AC3|nr:hypothetical protein [Streptomyces sp. NBC_00385]WRZ05817.1 hypothetical protein OG959_21970 [Streptomyces sp. NBC_00385]
MSYSIFLLRFVAGEVVALDTERFRQATAPYAVAGCLEEGFSQLRAEDGGEADLYHAVDGEEGMPCVTATHFSRGAMSGVLAGLAAALGAAILPQDGDALIFDEGDRSQLPEDLRGSALVIAPTADAFEAAFGAR